jgi:hypothetical protein
MPTNQSHNCSRSGADEACSRPVRRGQISYAIAKYMMTTEPPKMRWKCAVTHEVLCTIAFMP